MARKEVDKGGREARDKLVAIADQIYQAKRGNMSKHAGETISVEDDRLSLVQCINYDQALDKGPFGEFTESSKDTLNKAFCVQKHNHENIGNKADNIDTKDEVMVWTGNKNYAKQCTNQLGVLRNHIKNGQYISCMVYSLQAGLMNEVSTKISSQFFCYLDIEYMNAHMKQRFQIMENKWCKLKLWNDVSGYIQPHAECCVCNLCTKQFSLDPFTECEHNIKLSRKRGLQQSGHENYMHMKHTSNQWFIYADHRDSQWVPWQTVNIYQTNTQHQTRYCNIGSEHLSNNSDGQHIENKFAKEIPTYLKEKIPKTSDIKDIHASNFKQIDLHESGQINNGYTIVKQAEKDAASALNIVQELEHLQEGNNYVLVTTDNINPTKGCPINETEAIANEVHATEENDNEYAEYSKNANCIAKPVDTSVKTSNINPTKNYAIDETETVASNIGKAEEDNVEYAEYRAELLADMERVAIWLVQQDFDKTHGFVARMTSIFMSLLCCIKSKEK